MSTCDCMDFSNLWTTDLGSPTRYTSLQMITIACKCNDAFHLGLGFKQMCDHVEQGCVESLPSEA